MRKLLLLLLTLCTFAAQSQQFQNPLIYKTGNYSVFTVGVSMSEGEEFGSAISTALPKDTIMPLGVFMINVGIGWRAEEDHNDEDLEFLRTIEASVEVHDYYGRNLQGVKEDPLMTYRLDDTSSDFLEDGTEGYSPKQVFVGTEIGGHYNWSWTVNNGIGEESGHVQLNCNPKNAIWGLNDDGESELKEYKKLTIRSKINTGFPYEVTKYQGKAKYTVYSPDSVVICQKEIDLRISPDSTMNGQLQEDVVCEIDSARHGDYHVVFEAPFLDKPQSWKIEVIDPLAGASSKNPVDATYRLAERNFKEAGKGKGWKYSGSVAPTYFTDSAIVSMSAMVVRPAEDGGDNSFTLTQTVSKMPQGFYTLTLPVAFQPCTFAKMQFNEEILAFVDANGVSKKAKHILTDVARNTSVNSNGATHIALEVPSNDIAFANSMSKYTQKVVFEVKEDSLITIGVHKNHTDSLGEITAIGAAELVFYGDALPYGTVAFPQDSVFAAGDSLLTTVKLYDGLGGKVPEDNQISLLIAPITEQGTIDRDHILLTKEENADKAGEYDVSVVLPADGECPAGEYVLFVASLVHDGKYEVNEYKVIQIKGATAIEEVRADAGANEVAPIYNLSGVRLSKDENLKGVYIQGGKKLIRTK